MCASALETCRSQIGTTLATTSTLILVGAVLQTSRQVGGGCCGGCSGLLQTCPSSAGSRGQGSWRVLLPVKRQRVLVGCHAAGEAAEQISLPHLQVESLLQAPRLQQQLEQERSVIESLSYL
jgi:hypothetical protein